MDPIDRATFLKLSAFGVAGYLESLVRADESRYYRTFSDAFAALRPRTATQNPPTTSPMTRSAATTASEAWTAKCAAPTSDPSVAREYTST